MYWKWGKYSAIRAYLTKKAYLRLCACVALWLISLAPAGLHRTQRKFVLVQDEPVSFQPAPASKFCDQIKLFALRVWRFFRGPKRKVFALTRDGAALTWSELHTRNMAILSVRQVMPLVGARRRTRAD